jgi:hypothetical protein
MPTVKLSALWTFLVVFLTLQSCVRDFTFYEGPDVRLRFSVDTLRFDTVFTTQGSSTRAIKVFNDRDQAIRIAEVRFENTQQTYFRMNVDGLPGAVFRDVEILANDSIYLFVEVTIDPDQPVSLSPFVIEEAIRFETNGVTQRLPVEAWGQNAIYIPNNMNSGGIARLTCANMEVLWDDPRPYVIFGVLLVDSCTLRVLPGTRIHIHGGVVLGPNSIYTDGLIFTQPAGRLDMRGTYDKPIIIRTDRLEPAFERLPGQWGGIRLGPMSRGHVFEHVRIYNPIVGILVDSSATLEIRHAEIAFTSGSGLSSFNGDIDGDNLLIHSNGQYGIQLALGGRHRFRHVTLGNYGNTSDALFASNIFCLDPLCSESYVLPLDMTWENCILVGNQRDEITLIDATNGLPGFFNYQFAHCLVRIDELLKPDQWPSFLEDCANCLTFSPGQRLFIDQSAGDYRPDSLSVVRGRGFFIPELPFDLVGTPRNMTAPDIGCLEYAE